VKTAFLFPGQGSEAPGMGGAALGSPLARRLLARASAAVGVDVGEAIVRGTPALARTEVSQPGLVAVCLALCEDLQRDGVTPDVVAGHSVGELAAFCVAGYFTPEEAVDAAIERGRFMARAAKEHPGGMVALRREADARAAIAASAGALELAAHNAPEEWVVTGERAALAAVGERYGGVRLPVAGPWHSRAMASAEAPWRAWLDAVPARAPRCAVVANAHGAFVGDERPVELLVGQLTRPVQWAATLATLTAAGVSDFRAIGPGRVLRGLVRANLGTRASVRIEDGA